ncbi:MAG: ferredoxin [Deltaproteobacteria bacterium]|nr:MAG: ferredoxin [Deltaproteobacteria bacterium]
MQSKKSFASVNYEICNPGKCNPYEGRCAAVPACSHKVLKQLDGVFEPPMVFQDLCMGCRDCIEACPIDAIYMKHIGS